MANWKFIAVLHNLSVDSPVENDYLAIVPSSDQRAVDLQKESTALHSLVNNFTDQFGRRVSPSLLILHPGAPQKLLDQDPIIGFRNAVAISAIVQAWEDAVVLIQSFNPLKYSNYFDLYPISAGNDNESLVTRSPSLLGLDDPVKFHGQTSPELANHICHNKFYDSKFLRFMLEVWEKRFINQKGEDWRGRVLFRSLEMAYQASVIPFKNNSTIYDYGASIGLWVSAFEVLVRSETEEANVSKMIKLLIGLKLNLPRLDQKRYSIRFSKKNLKRCTLSQKLYHQLYRSRNDFLHGNPVSVKDVFVFRRPSNFPLTTVAPILYKQALLSFLGAKSLPDLNNCEIDTFMSVRNFQDALFALSQKQPRIPGQPTSRQ